METISETVRQEESFLKHEQLSTRIREAHGEIAFLRRRLDRLAKLQSLVKQKYDTRLSSLSNQLSGIEGQQWELRTLAKQLKGNRHRQSTIREQIVGLERRKKTIREVMQQIERYKKSSGTQIEAIEGEQEILSQRIHDLEQMLVLVEQAELDKKELETVTQRMYVTKGLLEEHIMDLSKRSIDLLFEFYIPPRTNRRPLF